MKKLGAILLALLSIPFLVLGILFLIAASTGPSSRLLVALAFFAPGLALLIFAIRRLRRLAETDPEALKTGAVELARRLGGELTVAQLRAEYRVPQKLAVLVLEELAAEGTCEREQREERTVYVFHELLPSLAKRVCAYCGTRLPVRQALTKCPNCGAPLEIIKT